MYRSLLFAVVAMFAAGSNASAVPIILDDFTVQNAPPIVRTSGPFMSDSVSVGDPSLTATRTLSIKLLSGGSVTAEASLAVGGGEASFLSGGAPIKSAGTISYDFSTPQDFSGISEIVLNVTQANTGPIPVLVTLTNAMGAPVTIFDLGVSDLGELKIPFGPVDRDQTTNISITVTLTDAQDFVLNNENGGIVFPQGDPIPEPATLATFGLLSLAGGYVARRKLKAKTDAVAAA